MNPESSETPIDYKAESKQGSAGVIGYLRESNFGNKRETADLAVERTIVYFEGPPDSKERERGFNDTQEILPDLIDALRSGGFGNQLQDWPEIKQAIKEALEDWNKHSPEWQEEVSKYHEDWGTK